MTFSELGEGLNKEVKEESFLVYVLVYLSVGEALMKSSIYIWVFKG